MPLIRLFLKPGIDKQNTEYGAEGGYIDCDNVRFRYGLPEKIGGWTPFNGQDQYLVGGVVDCLAWTSVENVPYFAVATTKKIYIFNSGLWYDITPIRDTNTGVTFTTTAGSTTVTVNDTNNGALKGDFVTFSSVTGNPGGITNATLQNEFEITSILTGSTYTITVPTAAASSVTAAGSANAAYQISVGSDVNYFDFGWGTGPWGLATYGTPRPASGSLALGSRNYTLDIYGEDLIIQQVDGGVYRWSENSGLSVRAAAIPGAPTKSTFALVSTPDRHLICFGTEATVGSASTQDRMFVRFSNQEDIEVFTESATNTAGGQRLSNGNKIISALRSRGQVLIFTDDALHGMQYLGPPYTFGFQQLGSACGIISPHAAIEAGGVTIWMGTESFFMFDGTVKKLPCTVQDYVFKDLNLVQGNLVYAGQNSLYNEITWWYCSLQSTRIDRCVTYNYLENVWTIGTMRRSGWQDVGVYNLPLGVQYLPDSTATPVTTTYGLTAGRSIVYIQEDGKNANGEILTSHLESGYFDIGDGEEVTYMKRFIPDFREQEGNIEVRLKLRSYPQATDTVGSLDPYIITPSTTKVDTRSRGRQIALRIDTDELDTKWRFGTMRIDVQPDGRR
jgi:hypothetical protein